MYFGYNTNGFAHHRLEDTVEILAELGYRGLGLTVDYNTINVMESGWEKQAEKLRRLLERHQFRVVVETGARYLLDPRRKHQPTLLSPTTEERHFRIHFLKECIHLASILQADAVSFWSGTALPSLSEDEASAHLLNGCRELCSEAEKYAMKLAFEPEPGMLIDTMERFENLHSLVASPQFGLTLDIGHLLCMGELPISRHILKWIDFLWSIHIEDMKPGVHDHLMFGEGEVDFPDVFQALHECRYTGGVYAELSRHSHQAFDIAQRSIQFLNNCAHF